MTAQIRLARAADYPAERLVGLETSIELSDDFTDHVDLIHAAIGETVPQGALFTYLFRRFGYPNAGWDDHKELACYLLTTTRPDMLMRIVPYAGGDSAISIRFVVPMEVAAPARDWPLRARRAWRADLLDWIEQETDMPEWMEGYIEEVRAEGMLVTSKEGKEITWRNVFDSLAFLSYNAERKGESDPRGDWHKAMHATYAQMVPEPGVLYRDADWARWDEADPLKPYAAAIMETLSELKRPVWVRDCPITIYGPVSDARAMEIEDELDGITPGQAESDEDRDAIDDARYEAQSSRIATSAGFPSGDLGNIDPQLFARIHASIVEMGDGDPKLGMERAQAALEAAKA